MGFGVRTESADPGRPLELLGLLVVLSAVCFPLHRTSSVLCLCIFQEPAGNTRWVSRMWKLQEVLPQCCHLPCTGKLLLKDSCLSRPSCPWSFLLSKVWGINKSPGSPWLWAMTLAFTSGHDVRRSDHIWDMEWLRNTLAFLICWKEHNNGVWELLIHKPTCNFQKN